MLKCLLFLVYTLKIVHLSAGQRQCIICTKPQKAVFGALIVPKEIKLLKRLLNITDRPEERFSALATAFCPGDDNEAKDPKAIYTTPKELHKWIKIMLDAYHLNAEETDLRDAKQMTQPVVIQRLFILKYTIEEECLEQSTSPDSQIEDTKSEESLSTTHVHEQIYRRRI